ncbi:sulfotransferase family protein [Salegentibacter flavus]|uniref:Sulfotransferase domain-containing protein n=1 Tax=Salegentibacter flavus TaxID=287099 RepID=A0A1I5BPR6_9FLAO|nr:sulfotransferase [Salegentibacter flavus]SFN76441.1 Sulfotransferase domain-containing protein [Salegentibacter flavus]
MKLDFVCIGAQKAGTTTLHDILKGHPDIYLPDRKEAQFFDINEMYQRGLDFYFSTFFRTYKNQKVVGNINPNLQLETRSIDRLISCFGKNIKVIFILRNPIKRAYSHYLMSKRRGYEQLSFLEALEQEDYRMKYPSEHSKYFSEETGHYEKNHFGYVYRSKYLKTLKYLYSQLPPQNIKVVFFEEFLINKPVVIEDILKFLNLPQSNALDFNIKSNYASQPKSVVIRDIIYKPLIFKSIIGAILPSHLKEFLKNRLDKLNSKPLKIEEKNLSPEDQSFIYETYFKKEIEEIETYLNLTLDDWKPIMSTHQING